MSSLSALDLNLLVALEALYLERNVTRAGRRLGLSQPATSGALAKLRSLLGDELFVRTPRGLEPTERCEALIGPVGQALAALRDALTERTFEPASSERSFAIGAVDAVVATLLPRLLGQVLRLAPRTQVSVRPIDPGSAIALLEARKIELAVCPLAEVPAHLESAELFRVPLTLALRPDHPLGAPATLTELVRYPHVLVLFAGPARTAIDDALSALGHPRHVAVVLRSFLAVPYVLASSDALAILPEPYARVLEAQGRVRCVELPAALSRPALTMRMVWPARLALSPALTWLRAQLVLAAREQAAQLP